MTISIKVPANNSRLLLLAAKFLRGAANEAREDGESAPQDNTTINGTQWEPGEIVPPAPAPQDNTGSLVPSDNERRFIAPAPNNVNAEERDINGVIWKAEFHATTKTKTAKEIWKLRKGMTDAEKVAAKEYIALFAGRETPAAPTNAQIAEAGELLSAQPLPPTMTPPAPAVQAPAPPATVAVPQGTPAPAPAPAQAPAGQPVTFPELMAKVNELNMAGTMTADQITELVKSMGFDGLGQIINQPEIISQIMTTLQNV